MKKNNRGSAIIEITLLVPILFGCIYFYIMSMLFVVEHGKIVDALSEQLYSSERTSVESPDDGNAHNIHKEGNAEVIDYKGNYENYDFVIEMKKHANDPVESLRRWQFVADTVH